MLLSLCGSIISLKTKQTHILGGQMAYSPKVWDILKLGLQITEYVLATCQHGQCPWVSTITQPPHSYFKVILNERIYPIFIFRMQKLTILRG